MNPREVLDIGCGKGDLLEMCDRAKISASGIDSGGHNIREVRSRNLKAKEGRAESLDFEDNEFDWVVLRHVLHHIPDPNLALEEAARVAQSGILLAEPWADTTVASQRFALDIDLWSKEVHRALGYFHRKGLSLSEVLSILPKGKEFRASVTYLANLERVNIGEKFEVMEEFTSKLPAQHPLSIHERQLKRRAVDEPISGMGTMVVELRFQ